MATLRTIPKARSLHVETVFGEPVVADLKQLGATWHEETHTWKVSRKHEAAVIKLLAGNHSSAEAVNDSRLAYERDHIKGRAKYKGNTYYVVGEGRSVRGPWYKLLFQDGSKSFFADAEQVEVVATYQKECTLKGLQEYAARRERERRTGICECWCHTSHQCQCGEGWCAFHHDGCDSCGCEN